MTRYFVCCEKCFEAIGKKNTKAARFWMDLCTSKMNCGNPFLCLPWETPEIRALELMGFITSTETKDHVRINIKGFYHHAGEYYFCIKGGYHDA